MSFPRSTDGGETIRKVLCNMSKKTLIISFIFLLLIVPFIIFLVRSQKTPSKSPFLSTPTLIPLISLTVFPLRITRVIPDDKARNIGLYPSVEVVFSRPLLSSESSHITITANPEIIGEQTISPDKTAIKLNPQTPLSQNQLYTINVSYLATSFSWTFTTSPVESIDSADKARAQTQADRDFALRQEEVAKKYPWYDKFPIKTSNYFLYFDADRKVFIGKIYTNAVTSDQQIIQYKNDIFKKMRAFEIKPDEYIIEWKIIPES